MLRNTNLVPRAMPVRGLGWHWLVGKLNFSCAVIGLTCMPTKPEPLNLGVPVVNFPRANAILARAQALLWVRD